MRSFTQLFDRVDNTTSTNDKISYLADYFRHANDEDAAWAVFLLSGRKRKRSLSSSKLRVFFHKLSGQPPWLYEECYSQVGDTAETVSLLSKAMGIEPQKADSTDWMAIPLHRWMEEIIPALEKESEDEQATQFSIWWSQLSQIEIFVLNKLMTGEFRVGISNKLVIKGLAAATGVTEAVIQHRLLGYNSPSVENYRKLFDAITNDKEPSTAYPFYLASPLENQEPVESAPQDWIFEWKWDGIRAQLIRRDDQSFLWSRGEDIVSDAFPEIIEASKVLPNGTVLDGELLAWKEGPLPFAVLQTRLNRKKVSASMRQESPVALLAYDLLEYEGEDIREKSWTERRALLEKVIAQADSDLLQIYPYFEFENWQDVRQKREDARTNRVEGLMVKRRSSPYRAGRVRGDWWKFKVDPYTLDAVLYYAQAGSGKRANQFTDYTFALWHEGKLVPFAKAYSGLDHKEIEELDRWIRRHTLEKFGPVRSVKTEHVFEIAFEGIQNSKRHKAGIAVRFPRILRWRRDKKPEDADTLENAIRLAESVNGVGKIEEEFDKTRQLSFDTDKTLPTTSRHAE